MSDNDMDNIDNPIFQQGYLFSEAEYTFLSQLLTSCAEAAKSNGNPKIYRECQRIVVRMRDHVFAGAVPDESYARHMKRIEKAFEAGDQPASQAAIRDLTTTMMRMSPDPAAAVSELLIGILASSLHQQAQKIYATAMEHASAQLLKEKAAFDHGGWPEPADVLDYLKGLFDVAAVRVQSGMEPFNPVDEVDGDPSDLH